MSYAKLFSSITESSLWSEPKEVRLLFVTMLAKANSIGFVEASILGLARVANLGLEEVEAAVLTLESPDIHSKNDDLEGRRIAKVPGGWMVLNYEDYRSRTTEEERKEYMRSYMRKYRAEKGGKQSVNNVKKSKESPSASALSEKGESEGKALKFPNGVPDTEWLARLEQDKTYAGIDVQREHGKMMVWCSANNQMPTRRRFVNWLNRAEKPMKAQPAKQAYRIVQ